MGKSRSTGKRVTGGSASGLGFGVGVSTTPMTTDRDIVQALVIFLEHRRVLFNPEYLEVADEVDRSVIEIGKELTEAIQQITPQGGATSSLRAMRAACRRYLDAPRQHFRHMDRDRGFRGDGKPGFFVALGELRAVFGAELKRLDDAYKLTMEPQLRELFPIPDLN